MISFTSKCKKKKERHKFAFVLYIGLDAVYIYSKFPHEKSLSGDLKFTINSISLPLLSFPSQLHTGNVCVSVCPSTRASVCAWICMRRHVYLLFPLRLTVNFLLRSTFFFSIFVKSVLYHHRNHHCQLSLPFSILVHFVPSFFLLTLTSEYDKMIFITEISLYYIDFTH